MNLEHDFELLNHEDAVLPEEELASIRAWLKPTRYNGTSGEYRRHLAARTDQTGVWLQDTQKYQQWKQSEDHGCIWVKGAPGAGKSVLTASVINDLQTQEPEAHVLFFFFRQIVENNRYPVNLMRDWLAQLLTGSIALQGKLHALAKHRQLADVSEEELWEALLVGLLKVKRAYCIVDAMDEMDLGSNAFLQRLNDLALFRPGNVKLLVMSRLRPDLQRYLGASSIVHVDLHEQKVGQEIHLFVSQRLEKMQLDESMQVTLAKDITSRSRGLFLYAGILCNEVLSALKTGGIPNLTTLPADILDMYTQTLNRQRVENGIDEKLQVHLLSCVTHSARPLRVRELAGLLSFLYPDILLQRAKHIAKVACYPFLQVLSDETVQVFHHSFTEFLLNNDVQNLETPQDRSFPLLQPDDIHQWLAITSMKVLIQAGSEYEATKADPSTSSPFLDYAQEYWLHHLSKLRQIRNTEIFAMIKMICDARFSVNELPNGHKSPGHELTTPLRIAAYTGSIEIAENLVTADSGLVSELTPRKHPMFFREEIPWSESSLAIAIRRGHLKMVEYLWSSEVTERIEECGSELILGACRSGSREIVQFLLDKGCRPPGNLFDPFCHSGAFDYRLKPRALQLVLSHVVPDGLLRYISRAAADGRYDAVKAVVDTTLSQPRGVANAPWYSGRFGTPLFQACSSMRKTMGHLECVKILAPHHPDIDAKENVEQFHSDQYHTFNRLLPSGSTVLHALVAKWSDENHHISVQMFQYLMACGADVNVKDDEGQTPLAMLFWTGWVRSVYKPLKILIDAGADIDTVDNKGDGILMRILRSTRDVGALKRLFQADKNRPDGKPQQWDDAYCQAKPFLGAFWYNTNGPDGQNEVLEYLLGRGATVEDGGEPAKVTRGILLHGQPDALTKVLDTRKDSSFLNELLWSAGSTLSRRGNAKAFLEIILRCGGNIDATNDEGIAPLMRSAISKTVAEALISLGADLTLKDTHGRTVLHHLMNYRTWPKENLYWLRSTTSDSPLVECLLLFIAQGCDINATDRDGRTVLDYALKLFSDVEKDEYDTTPVEIDVRKHWLVITIQKLLESCQPGNALTSMALHSFLDTDFRQVTDLLETPQVYLAHLIQMFRNSDPNFDINYRNTAGLTPLHVAASTLLDQGLSCMDILQSHGADLGAKGLNGNSILHIACRARNPSTVGYLCLQAPSMISQKDDEGRTPLFDACIYGSPECVALLLQYGADADATDMEGLTPFHVCVDLLARPNISVAKEVGNRSKRARVLKDNAQDLTKYAEHEKYTALYFCQAIMRALIDRAKGLEVANLSDILLSVIAYAASHSGMYIQTLIGFLQGYTEPSKSVVNYGKHSLHSQPRGFSCGELPSPGMFLASCSLDDLRSLRIREPKTVRFSSVETQERVTDASDRPIHQAWRKQLLEAIVDSGLTEVLVVLSSDERTVNGPISLFNEPIQGSELVYMMERTCESTFPKLAMFQILLQQPAMDVNMKILDGIEELPLIHLLAKGQRFWHLHAIPLIIANGGDIDTKNNNGQTALHVACKQDHPWSGRFVALLLELGADTQAKDDEGSKPFQGVRSKSVIKALQENNVDISNATSIPDLLLAIGRLDVDGVEIAMRNGVDVNQLVDDPLWTKEDYNPRYGVGSPIHNGWEATPLLGALQFQEFGQKSRTETHPDTRGTIIRLLLQSEPNLLEIMEFRHLDVYEEMLSSREQPPYDYCQDQDEDEELDTMPFIHGVFKYIRSSKRHLRLLLEYPESIRRVVNARGGNMDETLFLAACNAKLDFPVNEGEDLESDSGNPKQSDELLWMDSTTFFLQMMDLGADILATDNEGNNALHILLKNPCTQGKAIVQFLSRSEVYPLIHDEDADGWTPLQLALKILRPGVVLKLLSLEPEWETDLLLHDPEGYTPLHRMAKQILHDHVPVSPGERNISRSIRQPSDFSDECILLWNKCLAAGADIDAPDKTARGSPPIFHYFAQFHMNNRGTYYTTLYFPTLFQADGNGKASANLSVINEEGDSLLHSVVRKCGSSEDYEASSSVKYLVEKLRLDPLAENREGLTVVDLAAKKRLQRVTAVFKDAS